MTGAAATSIGPAGSRHATAIAATVARDLDPSWTAVACEALLREPTTLALVATAQGTDAVLGVLLARVVVDEAEILLLAVEPQARRRGIARLLLEAGLTAANGRGARSVFLEVAAGNTGAAALYEREGFVRSGRRPGYYRRPGQPPDDAILMARKLPVDAG